MRRLEVLGYWFNPDAPSELPMPQRLVGTWSDEQRAVVLAYLRAGRPLVTFPEPSFCRFGCGEVAMGTQDLTDGRHVWPEGLAHYVERHDVRLPSTFVEVALAAGGAPAPFAMPKPRFGLYDRAPWIAWGSAEGACLDLVGFELPDDEVRARIDADIARLHGDVDYQRVLLCNGATREVVLDLGGGALELREVRADGAPPQRFAGWHAWPALGSSGPRRRAASPSPAQRHPGRSRPGMSMQDFFSAMRDRKDGGPSE